MYQQPNHSFDSANSRRVSSNNPFRHMQQQQQQQQQHYQQTQFGAPPPPLRPSNSRHDSASSIRSTNSQAFEDWVERNKVLIDMSDEEEAATHGTRGISNYSDPNDDNDDIYMTKKPAFPPKPVRAGSDSSVNYNGDNRKMSSNNPFAAALNEPNSYVHRRDPPPPPATPAPRYINSGTPPARPPKPEAGALPPPSYEEAAGPERSKADYPREKSSSSSGRPHRSHSDSSKPHRREHRSHGERSHGERSHGERSHGERSHRDRDDKDRERRHRSSRNKSPSKKKPEPVKAKNLDTIDKLDVTAFFGGGFHHDGPFDACTPHRNKNAKQPPVMAFPADGPNNSIKGLAPNLDKNDQMDLAFGNYNEHDHNEIIGRKGSVKKNFDATTSTTVPTSSNGDARNGFDEDDATPLIKTNKASSDPTTTLYTPKQNPSVINFDTNMNAQPIHGSATAGLGSSTFLDGAPAPKITSDDYLSVNGGGLGRKKSLVQRLRKNSGSEQSSRRNSNDQTAASALSTSPTSDNGFGSRGSPIADDEVLSTGNGGNSLLKRVKSLKVGGRRG